MSRPLVVAPGSINVDLILKTSVLKGPKTFQGAYSESQGGKGSNQALAARRAADRDVFLVGCVGDDPWGHRALSVLRETGVNADHVKRVGDTRTGVVMEYLYGDGEVTIALDPGANARLDLDDIDAARPCIEAAGLLLAQIENPLSCLERSVHHAVRAGVPVMLDPSIIPEDPVDRQRLFDDVIPHIDIIAPNRSEARDLSGIDVDDDDTALAATRKLREFVDIVLITRGRDGALIVRGDEHRFIRALPVDAIDGGAAGDTFRGAWALALVEALEHQASSADRVPLAEVPFDALVGATRFANAAAALCVSRTGAAPSIPHRHEIEQLLATPQIDGTASEAAS